MTYELMFRLVHAIVLTAGFIGLIRGVWERWENGLTSRGKRQYLAFLSREFSVWFGVIWLAIVVDDPARQTILLPNYLVFIASLLVCFTAWYRTPYDERTSS